MAVQVPLPPPDDLRDDVACVWSATLEAEGLLIPDACIDVMWYESGRTVVCGPERHALTYRSRHRERVAGVRFRPGSAPRILRVSAAEIADQRIPLEDIVGSATARRAADRAGSSPSPGTALLCELRDLIDAAPAPDHLDAALDHELLSNAPPSVDHMATLTGVSARHVHRRAIRSYGYGPRTLTKLVRFQRLLRNVERYEGAELSTVAVISGYYDQSHMSRDCRAIAGRTPTEVFARHTPTFPAMSDPYKTDRRHHATVSNLNS